MCRLVQVCWVHVSQYAFSYISTNLQIADGAIDDISHIQVSTTGSDGQPQVITVYKEGQAQVLPQIVLGDGDGRQDMPSQIIVQEISLPEARNLEQSLIITNPRLVTKRVTPRGTSK